MAKIFWNMTVKASEQNPMHTVVTHGDGWSVVLAEDGSVLESFQDKEGKLPTSKQVRKAIGFAEIHGWL
jgi:hypothetical protein